jgi:hypothetical protein
MEVSLRNHLKEKMKREKRWLEGLNAHEMQGLINLFRENLEIERTWVERGRKKTGKIVPKKFESPVELYAELRRLRKCPKCQWAESMIAGTKE